VQKGSEENLRAGQLQNGSRPRRVPRKGDGLHHREAFGNLRPSTPATLPAHHPPGPSLDAKRSLSGSSERGLSPWLGQPSQGQAADAAEVVHQEG